LVWFARQRRRLSRAARRTTTRASHPAHHQPRGGLTGALILLETPKPRSSAAPWLLLIATLIFILAKHLTAALRRMVHLDINQPQHPRPFIVGCVLQFVIGDLRRLFGGGNRHPHASRCSRCSLRKHPFHERAQDRFRHRHQWRAAAAFVLAGVIDWPQRSS